jgi:hypothetical protein
MSIPCSNYIVKKDGTITGPGRLMNMSYSAPIESPTYLSQHAIGSVESLQKDWDSMPMGLFNRDFPGLDSPDDIAYLIYVHAPENMYGVDGEIVSRHREIMWRMNDD